jgi:hypothetical protein
MTFAVVVPTAHALVLPVSHDSPFADPVIMRHCRLPHPTCPAPAARTLRHWPHPRGIEREATAACSAAIQVSCLEAATPWPQPFLRRCPPLVTRIAASEIARGRRRTDEASRPKSANPPPDGRLQCLALFAPLAHRSCAAGLVLGASALGSIPSRNVVGLPPQSKCFFRQPELWRTHGKDLITSARGMPERSCLGRASTANPRSANNAATGPA